MGYDISNLIKLRLETQKIVKPKNLDIEPNPCYSGYEPIGLKDDGSPNCVPIKEEHRTVKEGFPIPSPEQSEDESAFIARCNKEMYDEFPDDAQRNAVCYQKWNESN